MTYKWTILVSLVLNIYKQGKAIQNCVASARKRTGSHSRDASCTDWTTVVCSMARRGHSGGMLASVVMVVEFHNEAGEFQ